MFLRWKHKFNSKENSVKGAGLNLAVAELFKNKRGDFDIKKISLLVLGLLIFVPLISAAVNFQINEPLNNSLVPLGNDTTFDINLTEPSGEKIKDVYLYIDGILNDSNSPNSDIITNLIFIVSGLAEGIHNWFVGTELQNGTIENSSTYTFQVNNITVDTSIDFQVNTPVNNSVVSLVNDTIFDINLTEPTGEKIKDVHLYIDGVLNLSENNVNSDIITNLIFIVSGLSEGIHNWFVGTELQDGTIENSSTYTFEVDNITGTPPINYTNSDIYNIPDDNSYYTIWLYVNFTEFLNETNGNLTKNKTKIKDDIAVKVKQTYSGTEEKFKLKTDNSSILFMVMKGKNAIKMLEKILDEKNKSNTLKDKDFTAILDVHLDPIFSIDANPNTGDNKIEVKGNKANAEKPDGLINLTGNGYSITVIDTGVNYSDPEFGGSFGNGTVIAGYDYCATVGSPCSGTDSDPLDFNSHGSHVAGILAAQSFGLAPNASIIAIKACNDDGGCSGAALMAGIDWSVFYKDTWNISSILMSVSDGQNYTTSSCPNFFGTAIQSAVDVGIPIIASTGNEGFVSGISYPACDSRVYAVGATDYNSTDILNVSNGQGNVTSGLFNIIHAPGGEVKSVCLGAYCVKSGTSMAAPHVAATFLLVKQLRALDSSTDDDGDGIDDYDFNEDGNFTIDDTFEIMKLTGRKVGNSTHKKLDVWGTVQYFQNHPAVRDDEDRVFNGNGQIQFPIGTLSSTSSNMTDLEVDQCVTITSNLISVNESDSTCDPIINLTTDLILTKIVNLSAPIPAILKNDKVCSLFDECSDIIYNATNELVDFTTNSFSNYSFADLNFSFDGAAGDNKNEVKVNKVHPKQDNGINLTGAGYTTCVIDSGVNYNHSQFDYFVAGYDYCASNDCVGEDDDPFDLNGHGTSVSGVIFSRDYGLAPEAGIVAVKVADADGDVSANAILGAIDWCVNNSATYNISAIVISISDGGAYNSSNCPSFFEESIDEAEALGILVVASVGNGANTDAIAYPSCEPVVVSVGATAENSTSFASFTNNGQNVKDRNLFAPGENITITNLTAGLSVFQGTSLSAPHVAAAKILIDQAINLSGYAPSTYDIDGDDDWDNDDVYLLLNLSGYRVGNGKNVKLDIWAAINYIRGRNTGEPAIRPEEDRLFNSEGEVQYTSAIMSTNASLEDSVEECVTVSNNFIEVNDELAQCSDLRDTTADVTMENLPLFNETNVFRDGSLCSSFFCPDQSYDNVTQIMTFSVLSFSNYTVEGTSFNFTIDAVEEISNVILNSTSGNNLTTDNLTAYVSPLNTSQKYIYDWKKDGSSIAVLNMPFEGGSNSTFTKDYSSFSNNGNVSGATYNATGGYDSNGAYQFDGINDHINISYDSSIDPANGSFTWTVWVKTSSNTLQEIINIGGASGVRTRLFLHPNANIDVRFGISDGTTTIFSDSGGDLNIEDGTFKFITFVRDRGNTFKIYVNGTEYVSINDTLDSLSVSEPLMIGLLDESSIFNGTIDDVMIYNRSLSAKQIQALYNNRTDLIVSSETIPGEVWQVEVTPNDGTQDGTTVQSNNLTILADTPPVVTTLLPVNNSIFNASNVIEIAANVSDNVNVDTVLANITLPNGTINQVTLTNVTDASNGLDAKYNSSFTIPSVVGTYNITFIANDTSNNLNATEMTNFTVLISIDSVVLNATSTDNLTTDNLTANVNGFANGNSIQFNWYKDNTLSAVFLGNATSNNELSSNFTTVGDVWHVNVTPKILTNNYDVSNATYSGVNFSVLAQHTDSRAVIFNNDGSKMYVTGAINDNVSEYDLSITFNVSSATFNDSTTLTGQGDSPQDISFNNDGSKFYFVDSSGNVYEFDVEIPFDVSNRTFNDSFDFSSQDTIPVGMAFNNDGTKLYMVGAEKKLIHEYSLSTPFDVSTGINISSFNVSAQDAGASGITFNNDGTKLYMAGFNSNNVSEYSLSTAFDVSTASFVQGFDVSGQESSTNGVRFNNDGSKMYVIGQSADTVFEYDLGSVESGTTVQSNSITILDVGGLDVFALIPVNNSIFNVSNVIEIAVNVSNQTSAASVDTVLANITFPNGTVQQIILTNVSAITNTSADKFNASFTIPSVVGIYNITFIANDTLGNVNSAEITNFTANDGTNPSVFDLLPVANNTFNISQTIEIGANVTDNILVDVVFVNLTLPNGTVNQLTLANVSAITGTNTDKFNASFAIPALTGQYNITFIANDTSGNINSTETTFFVSQDVVVPNVFDLIPFSNATSNITFNVSDIIEIGANVTDNVLVDVVYVNVTYPNGTVNQLTLTNVSAITDTDADKFNSSFVIPNLTGQYNLTFIANDSSNNINSTETTFFVGQDIVSPSVFDLVPVSNSNFNVSDVIEIGANVTDNILVDTVLANVTLPNGTVTQLTLSNTSDFYNSSFTISLLSGQYNITFIANDTSGNVNNTETTFFVGIPTIDSIILNSTLGTNLTNENLTAYSINLTPSDTKVIYDWRVDGSSIAALNMPFEGGSNSTFTKDYSSYSNSGTVNGAIYNSVGGYDGKGAYEFDGVNDDINVGTFDPSNDNLTICTLINPSNTGVGNREIVVKADSPWNESTSRWRFTQSGTSIDIGSPSTTRTFSSVLTSGSWQHLCFTHDYNQSGGLKLYKDGVLFGTQDGFTYGSGTGAKVIIGSLYETTEYFNGSIDEVMIFNRSLSAEQVSALYNNRTDLIVSGETSANEVWEVEATPTDGTSDGASVQSNNLTVQGIALTLNTPINGSVAAIGDVNFTVNFTAVLGVDNFTLNLFNSTGLYNSTVLSVAAPTSGTIGIVVNVVAGTYTWYYEAANSVGSFTSSNNTLFVTGVTINATSVNNLTSDNLTANVLGLFPTSASVQFDWYKNDILSAVFLGNATSNNELSSNFTTVGDVWYVNATSKILTNNYNVSNASLVQSFSIVSQEANPYGIAFNNDGTKMFTSGFTTDNVSEYSLSTAFNVSTASFTQGFYAGDQDGNVLGVNFNNDGTKMFVTGHDNDTVSEYALSTGFDVSTASFTQGFYVGDQQTAPLDIEFNNDGTKMFVAGSIPSNVTEYSLSTGYDVSTASFVQGLPLALPSGSPHGVAFNNYGTKMFVVVFNKIVYEYDLSLAFDISTASLLQNFSTDPAKEGTTAITLNNDGTKMYIVSVGSRVVSEYDIGSVESGIIVQSNSITILGIGGLDVFALIPINNSIFNVSNVIEIAVNVSNQTSGATVDTVLANITLPNGTINQITLVNVSAITNTSADKFNASFAIPNVTGIYNVTFIANDTANNVNNTEVTNFTANDGTNPSVFDLLPVANSTFNISQTIEIGANVTDNIAVDIVLANITLPNGTINQITLVNVSAITNTSADKFNLSFIIPNLTGQYNITFIANDSSGNINSTETTFFIGQDIVPPSVFDLLPVANTTFNVSSVIEIAANVTDNILVDTVFVNVTLPNGTVNQITLANVSVITGNNTDKFNSSFIIPNMTGQYNITFIANDTLGNVNSTETTFFVGEDLVVPSVFDLLPVSNTTYNVSDTIEIAANVTDNVLVDVVYVNITYPNGTVDQIALANVSVITGNNADKFNVSFVIPNVTGQYNITFIANDTSGNLNSTETTFFVGQDLITPSVFELRPVSNATYNVSQVIEIAANVTDNVLVDGVFVNITYPNSTVVQFTLTNVSAITGTNLDKFNASFLISNMTGQYNITFIANDSSGNINSTETTFLVAQDIIAPSVFDLIPFSNSTFNQTFNVSSVIEIAANVTDNIEVDYVLANITLPNGTVNQLTLSNVSAITGNNSDKFNVSFLISNITGQYNITFIANDSSGNINSTETTFFVGQDVVAPSVFDLVPVANTTYNVLSTIEIAANVTDNVLVDYVYVNVTYPNTTVVQLTLTNVSAITGTNLDKFNASFLIPNMTGQYNITFIANDTSGNLNSSETTFFNVTQIVFSISDIECSNDTTNYYNCDTLGYGTNITHMRATCTNSDGNVDEVRFTFYNSEDNINYIDNVSSTFNTSTIFTYNSSYVLQDSGNWTLNATCESGGNFTSSDINFTLAFGNISILLITPSVDSSVVFNEFFNFSANVSCTGGECGIINVTLDPEEVTCSEIKTCKNMSSTVCNNITSNICQEVCSTEGVEICENITIEEVITECNEVCITEEVCSDDTNSSICKDTKTCEETCRNITTENIIETCNFQNITNCIDTNCIDETKEICAEVIEESCAVEETCETIEIEKNSPQQTINGTSGSNKTLANQTIGLAPIEITLESIAGDAKIILNKNVLILNKELLIIQEQEHIFSTTSIEITNFTYLTPILAVELANETSATVTLPKLSSSNLEAIIKCDDWDFQELTCSSEWYVYATIDELTQDNKSVTFNVDSFSAYAGGNITAEETAFLVIWDENDIGMPNAVANTTSVKIINENITFYADYKIATNATSISSGTCNITIDGSTNTMNYGSGYYNYTANITTEGTYGYTINCTDDTYTNLSASDQVVIGALSNDTKGPVSTTLGDVPFYTTSNNPVQTGNLRGGEYEVINWNVNATGILDKVYDFFVEIIGIYVSYTNSTHINLQITANDTTNPVIISTVTSPSAVINGSALTLNLNAEDNIQVNSTWANVTLPDNTSILITSLPNNFSTTTQVGNYTVVFYTNDTSGNEINITKIFISALETNSSLNITIDINISLNITSNVNLKILRKGTDEALIDRSVNGTESINIPDVAIDLLFNSTFDNDTLITTIYDFNISQNTNNSISFGSPNLSEFIVTYGVTTDFNFTSAKVEVSYANKSFTTEGDLKLFKCDNFTLVSGDCSGSFNDITSSATQDLVNDLFAYNTTSFSGFGIKEVAAVVSEETEGVSSGGGGGSSYAVVENESGEAEEVQNVTGIPEQLFDISFNLDDSILQNKSELSAVVTFESFGTVPTLVNLTFIVVDENGVEIYRKESSITVRTEEVLRWNYEDLVDLSEGKYTAILETLYNTDIRDEFKQSFEIKIKKKSTLLIWILLGIVIGVLIIGIILALVRKNKGSKSKKLFRLKKQKKRGLVGKEIMKTKKIKESGKELDKISNKLKRRKKI